MKIQKFLHSCLLLEEKGTRVLIDPGDYCFAEKLITPEQLKPVDAILLTHNHTDHCDIDAIKKISAPRIIGSAATVDFLKAQGVSAQLMRPGEELRIDSMHIRAIRAPHNNRLTTPPPESIGFIINDMLLHPGDSFDFDVTSSYKVLALPVVAPWLLRVEAIELAARLKPEHIIPIHDGMLKDFVARTNNAVIEKMLKPHGVQLHPLQPGEIFEV